MLDFMLVCSRRLDVTMRHMSAGPGVDVQEKQKVARKAQSDLSVMLVEAGFICNVRGTLVLDQCYIVDERPPVGGITMLDVDRFRRSHVHMRLSVTVTGWVCG